MSFYASYLGLLERWPSGTQTRDVASAFGRTRVTVTGPADAPPVVLVHGGGATSMIWFQQAGELATTFRVFAIDQSGDPGMSRAEPDPPRTADDLVAWLGSVLDALGLSAVLLCGHSSGAALALNYTIAHPERVTSLSLLDPTQCFAGMSSGYVLRAVPVLLRPTTNRAAALLRCESGTSVADPQWVALYAAGAEFHPKPRTIIAKRPPATAVTALDLPVQVVVAGQSRVHDPTAVEAGARRLLRSGTVSRIDGAAHHSLLFDPRLSGPLREFASDSAQSG